MTLAIFIRHTELGAVFQIPFDAVLNAPTKRERRSRANEFLRTLRLLKLVPLGTLTFLGTGINAEGEPGICLCIEEAAQSAQA